MKRKFFKIKRTAKTTNTFSDNTLMLFEFSLTTVFLSFVLSVSYPLVNFFNYLFYIFSTLFLVISLFQISDFAISYRKAKKEWLFLWGKYFGVNDGLSLIVLTSIIRLTTEIVGFFALFLLTILIRKCIIKLTSSFMVSRLRHRATFSDINLSGLSFEKAFDEFPAYRYAVYKWSGRKRIMISTIIRLNPF